jgi:hypothetical protein
MSKSTAKAMVDENKTEKLLRLIVEGEQDQAEEMLKKDNNLLGVAGTITDLSGRKFKQITAFQYALWALDWHMWTMIQKYLPMEAQVQQATELESKSTIHGQYFNLNLLIEALQNYTDWSEQMNSREAENYWRTVVGGVQKLLPVHVVNEYCYPDRSLDPCPTFKEKLPRCRTGNFLDETGWTQGDWFTSSFNGGKLGETFAFYRGRGGCATMKNRPYPPTTAALDVKAIQALSTIRLNQRESLFAEIKLTSIQLALSTQTLSAMSASQSPQAWRGFKPIPKATPDSKRLMAITNFFSQPGRNIPKEIISIICDYEFETGAFYF